MYGKAHKAYQQASVNTASKEKILLMLYEGAIKFIKMARVRMNENNIPEKGKYISKALAIISELMNTLDHDVGGEISANLENLYLFMMDKLIDANIHNRIEDLDTVESIMKTLYAAWEDVINNPRADGVPSPSQQAELHAMFQKAHG